MARADTAGVITLKEAFDSAVSKTEAIAIQDSLSEQALERVNRARGGIFPTFQFLGTYQRQDQPNTTTGGSVGSAFNRPDQYSARFNVGQPLFRGLRDFAALGSAKSQARAADAGREQARAELYASVASSFYAAIAAQHDVMALQTQLSLTRKRVGELQARVRIGRSRRAELFLAQAQESTVAAELRSAEAALEQAREQLALLAGIAPDARLGDDSEKIPAVPGPVAGYLGRLSERPDLHLFQALAEAAEDDVRLAWGQHLPSLDFSGNYYLKRSGIQDRIKWDLGLSLVVPIFQGGVVSAQVREAAQLRRQNELQLSQARRSAETEVRTRHQALVAALEQVRLLSEANLLTEKNYLEQKRDYDSGLVTNLDVFQALDSTYDTRRALDRARCQAKAAAVALEAALGKGSAS